jgi:hypothetical protein
MVIIADNVEDPSSPGKVQQAQQEMAKDRQKERLPLARPQRGAGVCISRHLATIG